MDPFDYLFTFYGLLLGIAVANVAIGFADMWRDWEKIEVGGCPPLLACLVLLGGMNVWLTTWQTRHNVSLTGWQLLAAAGISLPYVFVSRAMFPGQEREPETSPGEPKVFRSSRECSGAARQFLEMAREPEALARGFGGVAGQPKGSPRGRSDAPGSRPHRLDPRTGRPESCPERPASREEQKKEQPQSLRGELKRAPYALLMV